MEQSGKIRARFSAEAYVTLQASQTVVAIYSGYDSRAELIENGTLPKVRGQTGCSDDARRAMPAAGGFMIPALATFVVRLS
jgi:hypothetical protein